MTETERHRQGEAFRKGYGWISALSSGDPRVREIARGLLYGKTAGKVRRQGVKRARPVRTMASQPDGHIDEWLEEIAADKGIRRAWRKRIMIEHGMRWEDVQRVASIRGRPSKELAPLRLWVASVLAELVDRDPGTRGRQVTRRALMVIYGLDERQMARLLDRGRAALAARESVISITNYVDEDEAEEHVADPTRDEIAEGIEGDLDGLDVADAMDGPVYGEHGRFK